ncbi:hypothetical protein [Streptomyces torulosus]|uniref:hypothetical protein n=1 Tax=Streptomyces torulosus TaxID=68276 RepID=UPI000A891280|nr:hypothetical protein [Streptomyces torulosus]
MSSGVPARTDHVTSPDTDPAPETPKSVVGPAQFTVRRYPRELVDHLRGRGRRKVLFGSNHPMITPGQALEHLGELGLDEEATELFLSGNARRIFRV